MASLCVMKMDRGAYNWFVMTILTILVLLVPVTSLTVPTYNIRSQCNRTVDMRTEGIHLGKVVLNMYSTGVTPPPETTCSVTLVSWSTRPGIQFYFDTISIPTCANSRLEIKQSSSGSPITYTSPTDFYGTKCGSLDSSALSSRVFTVPGRYLKVTFTWSQGVPMTTAFTLVFNTYSTGACDGDDDYACTNARCIEKSLTCNTYNTCGDNSSCEAEGAGDEEADLGQLNTIIISILQFGGAVLFIVIACTMFSRFKRHGRGGPSCIDRVCECLGECLSCFVHAGRACKTSCCKIPRRIVDRVRDLYREFECPCKKRGSEETEAETGDGVRTENLSREEPQVDERHIYLTSISHTVEYDDFYEEHEARGASGSGSDSRDLPPAYTDEFLKNRDPTPSAPPKEDANELAPPPHYEDVMSHPIKYMERY